MDIMVTERIFNRQTEAQKGYKQLLLISILFLSVVFTPLADDLNITEHRSIAPISIPIGESGVSGVAITRLQVKNSGPADNPTSISSLTVQLTETGGFNEAAITDIRVFYEDESVGVNEGEYDNGAPEGDTEIDTGGTHTFSSGTATIPIDPLANSFIHLGGGAHLYIVFDFAASANTGTTIGCEVTSVTFGAENVGTGGTGSPATPTAHGTETDVDIHKVTAAATGIAQAQAAANENDVELFRLDLSLADTSATAYLESVTVHRPTGVGADNWVTSSGVLLYEDDGDDIFEPGAGDGAEVASGTLGATTAEYATLTLSSSIDVPATGKSFFVAVNMNSLNAIPGQTFGLEVENPSTDIVFTDEIEDDTTNDLDPEYAFVPWSAAGLYEYDQTAYVDPTSTSIIPGSGNTFTVEPADDGTPPSVVTTVPDTGVTNVDRNANLTVIFSEWMDQATVIDTANFVLTDGVTPSISVGLSYDEPTQTLTVNPVPTLDWGTTYTATVKYTVEDYYDNPMGSSAADDYSWTFTTEPETLPFVSARSPGASAIDIVVDTTVQVTFSEDMDTATYAANFELRDSGAALVSGVVSASGLRDLIFTPDSDLNNDETYTVNVLAGVTDLEGSTMGTPDSWTFTTIRLYPDFDEPIAIKNRIGTGANSEALIFVTEPPGGPGTRVSVQVFTTTGRLVRTFYKNVPWTSIGSDPISWDGTNDRGQDLGPGMYFVQIRGENYKRVLKVMIVR
jgi:hypothetical protein